MMKTLNSMPLFTSMTEQSRHTAQYRDASLWLSRPYLRGIARVVGLSLMLQCFSLPVQSASLTLEEGVVVTFSPETSLVVRDTLIARDGLIFTSRDDNRIAGNTGSPLRSPASGDWGGVRLEKSATLQGTVQNLIIRYAGAGTGEQQGAALTLRGGTPKLQGLQITDAAVGLRLLESASPVLTGASFLRNQTGIEIDQNSAPTISSSEFVGNVPWAIYNKTPARIITATGNWWGHGTGPKESVTNPAGQGDAISAGVDYGRLLTQAPLLSPSIRLVHPVDYQEQRQVLLQLSCLNAAEYRVAENGGFAGVSFQALPQNGTQIQYTVSTGDGNKKIDAQYRSADGTLATASLSGGVLIDTQPPVVEITNPAEGSLVSGPIQIEITATDASGIAQVQLYLDDTLVITRTASPYTYTWNNTASAEGVHTLKAVATDKAGRSSTHHIQVTLSRAQPEPDTQGPELSAVKINGTPLANGATLSSSGQITLAAQDRSSITRIELLLDNNLVAQTNTKVNGQYTLPLDLTTLANGAHTLTLNAYDSLNNKSTLSYNITVTHAGPDSPKLTQPANGLTTRTAEITVSGTATTNSTVQLLLNNQPAGAPLTIGADAKFSTTLILAPGSNQIQATASNNYGTSAPSVAIAVTLDQTVPNSPSGLIATAQAEGKVKLTWTRSGDTSTKGYDLYRAGQPFTLLGEALKINSAPLSGTTFDDLPPQDGTWAYRVVAINNAGNVSEPSNLAQATSDGTPPRALSIVYAPQGKTDPVSGKVGQGIVKVTLTTSETLQAPPYLSMVPQGGAPIAVDLSKTGETTYTGSFSIGPNTPSGIANALFSARDTIGNRGTDIDSGATFSIETEGPVLSGITLNPMAPVKNVPTQTLEVTFTFSKAPASAPQVQYHLSGPARTSQPLVLTKLDSSVYRASLALPTDAGLNSPETLSFSYQAEDSLGNISNKVEALNRFQIYQGELPPLGVPFGLNAAAQPKGKIKLNWQAVDGASSYQLYRQAPGQADLQTLTRTSGADYIDSTTADGLYTYAVASVREENGEESLSGQSAPVQVVASRTAPGAPQNLTLKLTGKGIQATWQAPLASTVDRYTLYRASGTSITSVEGMPPLKTGIKANSVYDTTPSNNQGAYVVTALDAAGNESAPSNSAYLNASLFPVRNLKVEQIGNVLPSLSWDAPSGNVSGYLVYIGPENDKIKLTQSSIAATTLTDTGYTSGERNYTVATVDAQGVEMPRSILLPSTSTQVVSGLPLKRGLMNRLQLQVVNTSEASLAGVRAVVRLPVNKEATQFKDHKSESFTLGANQTRLIPVIVGGYPELPGNLQAQVGLEITPNEGEFIKIAHDQAMDVTEGGIIVGMSTDEFIRGGTGKLKLTIENISDVDLELLTATNNGTNDSSELRFKILDQDGNVLSTQAYKQTFGANVITLTNGQTVARIPAGSSYTSETFELAIPGASPDSIRVRLEVDKLRYHTGQDDEVVIAGKGSERRVSLQDVAYVGEVTDINPVISYGEQDIVIKGKALSRFNKEPSPNTALKLVLNQQGFERTIDLFTDAVGQFVHTFKPTATDSGSYKVSAVHPVMTDRPEQKSFIINRVTVGPTPYSVNVPKNYPLTIPFTTKTGAGVSARQLQLALSPDRQPTGKIPEGIRLQFPAPVDVGERQTVKLPVIFTADNSAQPSGSLILDVLSDGAIGPVGLVKIEYKLSEAKPYLVSTPNYLEAGMARGESQIESLILKNQGVQDALNLKFTLTRADGSAAPNWVSLASKPDGTLAVGEERTIDFSFTPPATVAEGTYSLKLNITGDNLPGQAVNMYVYLTQSGQGNVLFKAADIYTATIGKDGKLIPGLAGASVTLQNEDVANISYEAVTDALGEALFQNIPAGYYQFKAKASNHQETGGRLQVKPGITLNESIFLDYNLINVEWNVKEITIEDRYEITLNATYETNVPAAVVTLEPMVVNLPKMKVGDVFYGELVLTNHGLIRAHSIVQTLPPPDANFRYEFLVEVPSALEAKQRVTLPYRVIALKPLDDAADDGYASGGGCYNYWTRLSIQYCYECANGRLVTTSTSSSYQSGSGSTCSAGGSGWDDWRYTGGDYNGMGTPISTPGKRCTAAPSGGGQQCQ